MLADLVPVRPSARKSARYVEVEVRDLLMRGNAIVLPNCDARAVVAEIDGSRRPSDEVHHHDGLFVFEIQKRCAMTHRGNK
jgi:hypothetical protein